VSHALRGVDVWDVGDTCEEREDWVGLGIRGQQESVEERRTVDNADYSTEPAAHR
jgi:hypothetical protein